MKYLNKKYFIIIFILFSAAVHALEVSPSIFSDSDLDLLGKDAEKITMDFEYHKFEGEEFLYAFSDFHAVFDLQLDSIVDTIADHDNVENIFYRTVEAIDLNPEDPIEVPHRQYVHNSTKFMGIGQDYIYTNLLTVEKYTDSEFIMNWKMLDCEQGNFEKYEGFWYLKKLEPKTGTPRTYIRLYAETIFNNLLPLQDFIMNLFTESETEDVFESVYDAVKPRK